MHLLTWILVGGVVGWGTGRILEGNGYGPFRDVVMGIGGGIVGGLLMNSAGLHGYGGTIATSMMAMIGALLLTMLVAFANGRRVFVRSV
jgi:uncharacterized membrane protein YeaQ/YmgE (transglycosylase-associated protein family)